MKLRFNAILFVLVCYTLFSSVGRAALPTITPGYIFEHMADFQQNIQNSSPFTVNVDGVDYLISNVQVHNHPYFNGYKFCDNFALLREFLTENHRELFALPPNFSVRHGDPVQSAVYQYVIRNIGDENGIVFFGGYIGVQGICGYNVLTFNLSRVDHSPLMIRE